MLNRTGCYNGTLASMVEEDAYGLAEERFHPDFVG